MGLTTRSGVRERERWTLMEEWGLLNYVHDWSLKIWLDSLVSESNFSLKDAGSCKAEEKGEGGGKSQWTEISTFILSRDACLPWDLPATQLLESLAVLSVTTNSHTRTCVRKVSFQRRQEIKYGKTPWVLSEHTMEPNMDGIEHSDKRKAPNVDTCPDKTSVKPIPNAGNAECTAEANNSSRSRLWMLRWYCKLSLALLP